MLRLGRKTRAIEIRYQHLPAVATEEKKAANLEYLVAGWDPDSALLRDFVPTSSTDDTDPVLLEATR